MRVLDLFCGAGGAAKGYADMGHEVLGVDLDPQPSYPFPFVQGDALAVLRGETGIDPRSFGLIHASPPCQGYSTGTSSRSSRWVPTLGKDEPRLIEPVRDLLRETGVPYVLENVMGARAEMPRAGILCGSMFGLLIPRHRLIETSFAVTFPVHPDCRGLAKRSSEALGWEYRDMSVTGKGRRKGTSERWAFLLGISHPMTQHDLSEAIPPAYTRWIVSVLPEDEGVARCDSCGEADDHRHDPEEIPQQVALW